MRPRNDRRWFLRALGTAAVGASASSVTARGGGSSQGTADGVAPNTPPVAWSKRYDTGYSETANSVVGSGSGYLLTGSVVTSEIVPYPSAGVVKVDAEGTKLWSERHPDKAATDAVPAGDGGVVFAGPFISGPPQPFRLTKLNRSGEVVWDRTYLDDEEPDRWYDIPTSLVGTHDGGYLLAGSRRDQVAGETKAHLVKTDERGHEQWTESYGEADDVRANTLIATAAGDYLAAGRAGTAGWIAKVDEGGTERWMGTYPTGNRGVDAAVTAVTESAEGGYLFVGRDVSTGLAEWVGGVSEDGSQRFSTFAGPSTPRAVLGTADGGALVGGETRPRDGGSSDSGYLREVDATGEEVWVEYVSGSVNSIEKTADGGCLLAGSLEEDYWLCKVQTDLRVGKRVLRTGVMEAGRVTAGPHGKWGWTRVDLLQSYDDPVVVMGPASYEGIHPCHARIRDVGGRAFEFKLEEWQYSDGWHTAESLHYLVVDRGRYGEFSESSPSVHADAVEAGNSPADTGSYHEETPVILTQPQTINGSQPVVSRVSDVASSESGTGFQLRLQEEEANGWHMSERIGYTAVAPGTDVFSDGFDTRMEAGTTETAVTNRWYSIQFEETYRDPWFFADLQTYNGPDTATLRYRNLTATGVDVFVEEERSEDDETYHLPEEVGYLVIESP